VQNPADSCAVCTQYRATFCATWIAVVWPNASGGRRGIARARLGSSLYRYLAKVSTSPIRYPLLEDHKVGHQFSALSAHPRRGNCRRALNHDFPLSVDEVAATTVGKLCPDGDRIGAAGNGANLIAAFCVSRLTRGGICRLSLSGVAIFAEPC
jgi:hypothetical protein